MGPQIGPIPLVSLHGEKVSHFDEVHQNGIPWYEHWSKWCRTLTFLFHLVESTNEENKKPESPKKVETSPPPFSIPDTGLISCDWEPSMLDPGRGMFPFSKDNAPKRADCKQQ